MKIQFEGKIKGSSPANYHVGRVGEFTFTYEKPVEELAAFLRLRPAKIQITLEYETPIESCLLCGSDDNEGDVILVGCSDTKWRFECTKCATLVVLYAETREDAIEYFNQGEPR